MKNKIKKLTVIAAAAGLLLSGCGGAQEKTASALEEGQSDLSYVKEKGTFVIGITDFAPMDYMEDDKWTGFDAELAEAFAQSIGVTPEFEEIDWDKKAELLRDGEIDCIWNGMTLTEELQETIDCSKPYLSNAQVVVVRKEDLEQFQTVEDCQHMLFAAESGSTGEELLKDLNYRYAAYDTQKEALQSVTDKKADAAVCDIIMAGYYTKDGNEFDGLGFQIQLNDEKICVGLRKDSDLTELLNDFLEESVSDKTMSDIAAQYGIEDAVLK